MKLTSLEIDQLYTFTSQHYVEWYDLQLELVDHLANAIESQWQENPTLTFDEALNAEFKKFGVFGFMSVVEEKQRFLNKKYKKLIWKYYKEFFRLPKIILTIMFMFLICKLLILFDESKNIILGIIIIFYLFLLGRTFYKEKFTTYKNKTNQKKWLFEDISIQNKNILLFVLPSFLINGFNLFFKESHFTIIQSMVFSVFLVLTALLIYLKIKIIPKKVSEELAKNYPDY